MKRQYDVLFYIQRTVNITVDCDSGDDPVAYALDQLVLHDDETIYDTDVTEGAFE